ncbi:MAG: hypothetical protein JZU52_20725, partial [Lamprocystis purpurea]|nr:hypothetical protein [Lamprocystis purpurea]
MDKRSASTISLADGTMLVAAEVLCSVIPAGCRKEVATDGTSQRARTCKMSRIAQPLFRQDAGIQRHGRYLAASTDLQDERDRSTVIPAGCRKEVATDGTSQR